MSYIISIISHSFPNQLKMTLKGIGRLNQHEIAFNLLNTFKHNIFFNVFNLLFTSTCSDDFLPINNNFLSLHLAFNKFYYWKIFYLIMYYPPKF